MREQPARCGCVALLVAPALACHRRWLAVTGIAAGGFVALLLLLISLFSG
jgi:hypothetical protein